MPTDRVGRDHDRQSMVFQSPRLIEERAADRRIGDHHRIDRQPDEGETGSFQAVHRRVAEPDFGVRPDHGWRGSGTNR